MIGFSPIGRWAIGANERLVAAPVVGAFTIAPIDGLPKWVVSISGGRVNYGDATVVSAGLSAAGGVGVEAASVYKWNPAAAITEIVQLHARDAETLTYGQLIGDALMLRDILKPALPAVVGEGIGIASAIDILRAVTVLEQLGISARVDPAAVYGAAIAQSVVFNDHLKLFLSGSLGDFVDMQTSLLVNFHPTAVAQDGIGVNEALANQLLFGLELEDGVALEHDQILKMIFSGDPLLDGMVLSAAYVSPNGTFTTWAVNTRTGAVTEYKNFEFNSFAAFGRSFLAASSTGLYELDGETDAGKNIIAQIKGGLMQLAGSRFTGFKAAYIGMRVHDDASDFFLKMTSGDDKEYVYAVRPNNQMTTKVNMGKGLRARYFSFELVSSGADFDLDTIEFVPMVAQRRI